jgi:hypothetical protein
MRRIHVTDQSNVDIVDNGMQDAWIRSEKFTNELLSDPWAHIYNGVNEPNPDDDDIPPLEPV